MAANVVFEGEFSDLIDRINNPMREMRGGAYHHDSVGGNGTGHCFHVDFTSAGIHWNLEREGEGGRGREGEGKRDGEESGRGEGRREEGGERE